MRLGQLSRKYNIPLQELLEFLDHNSSEFSGWNLNSKVSDNELERIFSYFEIENIEIASSNLEIVQEVEAEIIPKIKKKEMDPSVVMVLTQEQVEKVGETTADQDLIEEKKIIQTEKESEQFEFEEVDFMEDTPSEEEISQDINDKKVFINSNHLLELVETEDFNFDLDKIDVIKVPKKKLEGLKVVGKVELPDENPKKTKKQTYSKVNRTGQLSEEKKERRRLRAKKKKEIFEARQQQREEVVQKKKLKARKTTYYKERMEKVTMQKFAQKQNSIHVAEPKNTVGDRQPKTLIGRFWKWLNT